LAVFLSAAIITAITVTIITLVLSVIIMCPDDLLQRALYAVKQEYLSRSLDKWSFNVFHLDRITAGETINTGVLIEIVSDMCYLCVLIHLLFF